MRTQITEVSIFQNAKFLAVLYLPIGLIYTVMGIIFLAYGIVVAGIIFMGISIPISYFIQASQNAWMPGFNLGALGMAWKMVVLNCIFVNSVSWWIAKKYGWKFDWAYQVVGVVVTLFLGWISYELIMGLNSIILINIYFQIGLALIIYGIMITVAIWFLPWLTGYSQEDIKAILLK